MITNEKGLSDLIHSIMHKPDKGHVDWKLQDVYRSGIPDKLLNDHGNVGFFEQKYIPLSKVTKREGRGFVKLTAPQRRSLIEWWDAGGTSFLVVGRGEECFFFKGVRQVLPAPLCYMTRDEMMDTCTMYCELNRSRMEATIKYALRYRGLIPDRS